MTDKYGKVEANGLNSRTNDTFKHLNISIDDAIRSQVDLLVIGGDMFHKMNPPEKLRHPFIQALNRLEDTGIIVDMFPGNHDTDGIEINLQSEGLLAKDINYYTKAVMKSFRNLNMCFIPWMKDEPLIETLKNCPENSLIFGHWGIKGALASGTEIQLTEGIEQSLLSRQLYTFVGHYHRFQWTDNYAYVGSSTRLDMSEAGHTKGYFKFKITSTELSWEFIDFHDRPMVDLKIIEGQPYEIPTEAEGRIIKVSVEGSNDWILSEGLWNLPAQLRKLGAHRVIDKFKVVKGRLTTPYSPELIAMGYTHLVNDYAAKHHRPDLANMGQEFLRKANEIR